MPLGSTEDRVVGSLNLEIALSQGKKSFEPGLLANANRGYLYIDEVNLLEFAKALMVALFLGELTSCVQNAQKP